jgi:hypothetical protein
LNREIQCRMTNTRRPSSAVTSAETQSPAEHDQKQSPTNTRIPKPH